MTYTDYAERYARLLDRIEQVLHRMPCLCRYVETQRPCARCRIAAILEEEPRDE